MSDNEQKGGGSGGIGCGLFFIGGCLGLIITIVFIGYILVSKPAPVWSTLVDVLNGNITIQEQEDVSVEEAKELVNGQIEDIGENTLEISEEYLTPLARERFGSLKDLVIDIEDNAMNLYWVIDETVEDKPLYGRAEITKNEEGELTISRLGVPQISFPEALNRALFSGALVVLNIGNDNSTGSSLIYQILSLNESIDITEIDFEDDTLQMTVNVEVNLF